MKNIEKLLKRHSIISFDIFDTLLIRPYINPYHILKHIEQYTGAEGFEQARYEAEGKARYNSCKEDICLDDIYQLVDKKFQDLKTTELLFEETLLKANPKVLDIYLMAKKLNKKIIIVSDMYLPKDFLEKVLKKNKYNYWDKFYLSGDIGLAKYTGNLYKVILEDFAVTPDKILHIGDSITSDIKQARKHGIHTLHIPKNSDVFFQDKVNKRHKDLYLNNKNNLVVSIILSILVEKYTKHRSLFKNQEQYWKDFGYCIGGPIGYGFTNFILKQAINNKYDELLFIARDGYVLQKLTNILKSNKSLKTYYIYAQRILRARMLLDYGDEHNADLLLNVLDEKLPRTKEIKTYKDKVSYLNSNTSILNDSARQKCEEYVKYLKAQGVDFFKNIAVVDTGAATFSAQQILEKALGKKVCGLYTIISRADYAKEKNISYNVWSPNPNDIKNITNLIEFCFSSPEMPIIDLVDGKPVYIKHPRSEEIYRTSIYPMIASGILDFAYDIKDRLKGLDIEFSAKEVNKYIESYCANLSHIDTKMLEGVYSSSNASHTEYNNRLLKQIKVNSKRFDPAILKHKIFSITNEYKNNIKRKNIIIFFFKISFKVRND